MSSPASVSRAEALNAGCQCLSLDRAHLAAELERVSPGFHDAVMDGRPHLFADSVVFVCAAHLQRMAELAAAMEQVSALPAYRAHVLSYAPATAQHDPGTPGVFLGYDFHVGKNGPQLIEINTNAGGGLLNAVLTRAQTACCTDVSSLLLQGQGDQAETAYLAMFQREWQLWSARRHRMPTGISLGRTSGFSSSPCVPLQPLRRLAIVDTAPAQQYLYPEFVLFARLFAAAGIDVRICDPSALSLRDGQLWHGDAVIDLVYNRLTDFALDEPAHAVLRAAYLADAALITPHPRAHALYADKRNLTALTDDALLRAWGVDAVTRALLTGLIPHTELVRAELADDLWARRRELFFKPAAGYGSRAAYRGDKLTKRVFDDILAGNYIAQALVPPSQRTVTVAGQSVELKLDLRNYAYNGAVQLVVARLWQGQTTNFRTPGGGFAPVLRVPNPEHEAVVTR